jgi:hypothetical protein
MTIREIRTTWKVIESIKLKFIVDVMYFKIIAGTATDAIIKIMGLCKFIIVAVFILSILEVD